MIRQKRLLQRVEGGKEKGAIGKEMGRRENDPAEIEVFKREVDLRQFAVSEGYQIDPRESWRGSAVLRRGADKIVVTRRGNGQYVFFSVRDDRDHGTIIDFLQRRRNVSLGEVRHILRAWAGGPGRRRWSGLQPAPKDRLSVAEVYRAMAVATRHGYLERERAIPASVLSSPRFADRVRVDDRGNAIFPHFDRQGLCGYEIKNRGFTGFARGGETGLWGSRTRAEDWRLVLAESAIDALSYAALFPDVADRTRYASLAGRPSPKQSDLLQAAIGKLPVGSEIIAAFDADPGGRMWVQVVRHALAANENRTLKIHFPAEVGQDWNDVLRNITTSQKEPAST